MRSRGILTKNWKKGEGEIPRSRIKSVFGVHGLQYLHLPPATFSLTFIEYLLTGGGLLINTSNNTNDLREMGGRYIRYTSVELAKLGPLITKTCIC